MAQRGRALEHVLRLRLADVGGVVHAHPDALLRLLRHVCCDAHPGRMSHRTSQGGRSQGLGLEPCIDLPASSLTTGAVQASQLPGMQVHRGSIPLQT